MQSKHIFAGKATIFRRAFLCRMHNIGLDLDYNSINLTQTQVDELQAQLPNCKIYFYA